ncbi:Nif3-like dinuclear metal center hexameric protein [Algoriphagus aestuariicola]|jgi:putative NIF3 family GTP cyclohydrolase 1 type 2|uniref:Nif3-like dinuclear metal center hexameric protein n=1 Tax=Algoriphagus aestuariicola TaxID=1852016 RepID=A0ABS3BUE4_9BACT|nr:Nif3-like dinuclear metal center hexameric protein [Algoriphagus aestuariicola]MBN7802918.1 Nif3-like dinuclear metal center hexameric protein [Algoriphagus aestuariicola]
MIPNTQTSRREFLLKSAALAGAGLVNNPFPSFGISVQKTWTVGEIIDAFVSEVPNAPFERTVDTIKVGSRDTVVTGVVTTMFTTLEIIQKAIELKANLIIPHEPTFFSGQDETDYLQEDPVFRAKYDLMERNGITLWRNHDYVHRMQDDGVRIGVVAELGWNDYYVQKSPILNVPKVRLRDMIHHIKSRMNVPAMRFVGDLDQVCSKVLLLPGAVGGRMQITRIMEHRPDVLVCGESNEWETPEYVRAANEIGMKLSMIEIGHSASEEGGSEFLKNWLVDHMPDLPVHHIPSGNSLQIF